MVGGLSGAGPDAVGPSWDELGQGLGLDEGCQSGLSCGGLVVQVAAGGGQDRCEGDAVGVQWQARRGVQAGLGGADALGLQLLVGDEQSVDLLQDSVGAA